MTAAIGFTVLPGANTVLVSAAVQGAQANLYYDAACTAEAPFPAPVAHQTPLYVTTAGPYSISLSINGTECATSAGNPTTIGLAEGVFPDVAPAFIPSPAPEATVLTVTYNGSDPFDVACLVSASFDPSVGGSAIGIFTIGGSGYGGTALSNPLGTDLAAGDYAADFVVDASSVIQQLALRTAIDGTECLLPFGSDGLAQPLLWGNDGSGGKGTLNTDGGATFAGVIVMASLPTSDPHNAGQLYTTVGVVHVSAG